MKRIFPVTALVALLLTPAFAPAQSLAELEDRLRRAERDLESVKEANDALRKRVSTLDATIAEVSRLAVERANANNNLLKVLASKSELDQLEKALKESEHRREADKKWFVEQLKELTKVMGAASATPPPAPPTPKAGKAKAEPSSEKTKSTPHAAATDKGVYHVVEKDQTALEILKAYNDDLKAKGHTTRITLKQLEAANSGVKLDKLRTGQKLFIPIPEK